MTCYISQTRPWLYISGLIHNLFEVFLGSWHYLTLLFDKVPRNTVLLAEPNAFHGECLPGYLKYFRDLGYEVVVLCRYANYKEDPFCRFSVKPRCYCLTIWGMRRYLRSRKIADYDYVLLTSVRVYLNEYRYFWRYPDFLKMLPRGKRGVGLIEHSFGPCAYGEFWNNQADDSKYLKELFDHSFVLTGFAFRGREIPMLNPHYFGDIKPKENLSEGKRVFIVVGKLSGSTRNFQSLFEALSQLPDDLNYELRVIGSGTLNSAPEKIQSKIKILGRLNFEEMYCQLEQADFFLPLLDPKQHSLYLEYCTSGSRQLILGFNLPAIIHKAFAVHYGFTGDSCLTYSDDETFEHAFVRALQMHDDEYSKMRQLLKNIHGDVFSISLDNLQKHIDC